jgi:hypothetical protein
MSVANSTTTGRPDKPYPEFPLYAGAGTGLQYRQG